jgi:hypothetical protein
MNRVEFIIIHGTIFSMEFSSNHSSIKKIVVFKKNLSYFSNFPVYIFIQKKYSLINRAVSYEMSLGCGTGNFVHLMENRYSSLPRFCEAWDC